MAAAAAGSVLDTTLPSATSVTACWPTKPALMLAAVVGATDQATATAVNDGLAAIARPARLEIAMSAFFASAQLFRTSGNGVGVFAAGTVPADATTVWFAPSMTA